MTRVSDKKYYESLAFADKEIGTASHDAIVMWLYERSAFGEFWRPFLERDSEVLAVRKRRLEQPVKETWTNGQVKTVGFIDLYVEIQCRGPVEELDFKTNKWRTEVSKYGRSFAIEVKSRIVAVGDVLRQMNYYRSFNDYVTYAVCAPDFPHADVLRQQGLLFIPYSPDPFS